MSTTASEAPSVNQRNRASRPDGRSASAVRLRKLREEALQGVTNITATHRVLAQRVAALRFSAEIQEGYMQVGDPRFDAALHSRLVSAWLRTLRTLRATDKITAPTAPADSNEPQRLEDLFEPTPEDHYSKIHEREMEAAHAGRQPLERTFAMMGKRKRAIKRKTIKGAKRGKL